MTYPEWATLGVPTQNRLTTLSDDDFRRRPDWGQTGVKSPCLDNVVKLRVKGKA